MKNPWLYHVDGSDTQAYRRMGVLKNSFLAITFHPVNLINLRTMYSGMLERTDNTFPELALLFRQNTNKLDYIIDIATGPDVKKPYTQPLPDALNVFDHPTIKFHWIKEDYGKVEGGSISLFAITTMGNAIQIFSEDEAVNLGESVDFIRDHPGNKPILFIENMSNAYTKLCIWHAQNVIGSKMIITDFKLRSRQYIHNGHS